MAESNDREQALVAKAIAGDTQSFGQLYERNMDAIYRYIFFRVENEQEAEDLTEHVFLKAWESLPDYRHQGFAFSSWLYRIAHNTVVDHYRRRRFLADGAEAEVHLDRNSEEPPLEQIIQQMEEKQRLIEAVKQLPDLQRDVILLRFVEGMSHEQVAEIVEKSTGACRTIQYRALKALELLLTAEKVAAP
jgi:RNA polymerase sigma-70 factor (ECF subfamily)